MISACDGERWELATGQEVYVSRTIQDPRGHYTQEDICFRHRTDE